MPEHSAPPAKRHPRVVVADPDPRSRAARTEALRAAGFVVSAQTGDGGDAADLAVHYAPDLLLLTTRLHRRDALDATRRVLAARPTVAVVLLVDADDGRDGALAALQAGARGILAVDTPDAALHAALHAVHLGHGVVPPELLAEPIPVPGRGFRPIHGALSNREWEIVDLLIAGRTVAEVADALFLTQATMRSHLKHMYAKLGVHSRAELLEAARQLFAEEWSAAVSPRPT